MPVLCPPTPCGPGVCGWPSESGCNDEHEFGVRLCCDCDRSFVANDEPLAEVDPLPVYSQGSGRGHEISAVPRRELEYSRRMLRQHGAVELEARLDGERARGAVATHQGHGAP